MVAIPWRPRNSTNSCLRSGLDLAGLDGFGGDFVGNIGQNGAEAHHISGAGDLKDHGLAVA